MKAVAEERKMAEERKDFALEVLGSALAERAERKNEFVEASLAMQARLFATLAGEVIERFGEEGRQAVSAAVRRCGERRGRRLAERAASEGRDNDFATFLLVSDLDTGQLTMVPEAGEGSLRVTVSHCPFADACREWGLEEYGMYFCRDIDAAIMRGYNPERYEAACERNLTEGSDACAIVYRLK